jgi:dTMP kinase
MNADVNKDCPLHRFTTTQPASQSNLAMKDAMSSKSSKNLLLDNIDDSGVLIAFEGPDGSGKTTQRKLFKSWLESMQENVVVSKWNSSPLFKPLIKARKAARQLDPRSYATLHAADFWHRYETVIQPALASRKIVLADRYVFTGIARDTARGSDREWSMGLYAGVRKPDVVFYFNAPVETCAMRIADTREIKFYEAGQDITGLNDAYESYLRFAAQVVSEYERLHHEFGFVVLDAEKSIYEQHRCLKETFLSLFPNTPAQSSYRAQFDPLLSQVDV